MKKIIIAFAAIILMAVVLLSALTIMVFTGTAVMTYANIITFPGVVAICLSGAWLFAKARESKPRKFFDYLARAGFWYFSIIIAFMVFVGLGLMQNEPSAYLLCRGCIWQSR